MNDERKNSPQQLLTIPISLTREQWRELERRCNRAARTRLHAGADPFVCGVFDQVAAAARKGLANYLLGGES